MAAKDMEMSASIAAQHMKRFPEAASSYQKASNFFNAHGSADRASECLEKAAK